MIQCKLNVLYTILNKRKYKSTCLSEEHEKSLLNIPDIRGIIIHESREFKNVSVAVIDILINKDSDLKRMFSEIKTALKQVQSNIVIEDIIDHPFDRVTWKVRG